MGCGYIKCKTNVYVVVIQNSVETATNVHIGRRCFIFLINHMNETENILIINLFVKLNEQRTAQEHC